MRKKLITAIIALTLALSCLVGVTVAWLFVDTDPVVNTFAPSNIELVLEETDMDSNRKQEFQMVPGVEMAKDPKITVTADIDCYVFVKIVKENNPDTYLDYDINTADWTALNGVEGVYYRAVTAAEATSGSSKYVLAGSTTNPNGCVTTKSEITKDQMDAIVNKPTLTFTAYAIQQAGFKTVAEAWAEASKQG